MDSLSGASAGASGTPNLYDVFRLQRQLAAQQTGNPGSGASGGQFSSSATATSAAQPPSSTPAAQSAGTSLLSNSLSSLLLQFQNLANGTTGTSGTSNAPISQGDFQQAYTAAANQAFAKLDTNGDGTISQSEAQAALQPQQGQQTDGTAQAAPGSHGHHHHHHGGGGASASAPTGSLEQLLQSDANGTGGSNGATTAGATASAATTTGAGSPLTQSAFEQSLSGTVSTSQADQMFAKLDKNGDGTIDQSEAQNALKHNRHAWNAQSMQSPSGTSSTGGQGGSSQSTLSGASTLLFAQQMGQAA